MRECLSACGPCLHYQSTGNQCDVCRIHDDDYVTNIRDKAVREAVALLKSLGYEVTSPSQS
jgi:hypothetical protein